MGRLNLLRLIFCLLFPAIQARDDCQTSFCGKNPQQVRFPFRLQGQRPRKCGYTGFDLTCTRHGSSSKLVLSLPFSGDFWVREINYLGQEIELHDPDGCLARRLLSLDLSSSPFLAGFSKNYTFLSCPSEHVGDRYRRIDCLSNFTTSVLATSGMNLAAALNTCTILVTLPVPVSLTQYDEWLSSEVNDDIRLTWDGPNCQNCESRGDVCGLENSSSDQILCFPSKPGKPGGLKIFKVVVMSIIIPAIFCSVCIACFIFMVERRRRNRDSNQVSPPPVTATIISGLDDSTIESYSKVVLGESKRLAGRNGVTCPICLADYCPKDTVRFIPHCEHCFHSDCIDEWLRRHGSCPLCRNSPSPAHGNA